MIRDLITGALIKLAGWTAIFNEFLLTSARRRVVEDIKQNSDGETK